MKELKLKALNLGVKQLLNREQMKNVTGGDGSGGGSGSGNISYGKCCGSPNGEVYGSGNISCSGCVSAPSGSHLSCQTGLYLVAC